MLETLIIVGVSISFAAVAVGFLMWRRRVDAQYAAQDLAFRCVEANTGKCAACDGAGRRLQIHAGPTASSLASVVCFRCGGRGEPPPSGIVKQRPIVSRRVAVARADAEWLRYKRRVLRDRLSR